MFNTHPTFVSLLACFLTACAVSAAPASSFPTVADALPAANLTILLAAVKAAGIEVKPDSAWTILAPTNYAFTDRLNKTLGISPADLIKPENKATLVKVLSYHVIPSGAVLSTQLKDCQQLPTSLAGATPLTVRVRRGKVDFEGATNDARVSKANIKAGRSVVHIVDDVLLPAGIGKKPSPPSYPSLASALTGANLKILSAAIQASGLTLRPDTRYTILAPSDFAITARLNKTLGIAPADLLKPENRAILVKILSYHIIPSAAVLSTQLQDRQQVSTALAGAAPLTVRLRCNKVDFVGASNDVRVTMADVKAGRDIVVHVVDDVLLPAL